MIFAKTVETRHNFKDALKFRRQSKGKSGQMIRKSFTKLQSLDYVYDHICATILRRGIGTILNPALAPLLAGIFLDDRFCFIPVNFPFAKGA